MSKLISAILLFFLPVSATLAQNELFVGVGISAIKFDDNIKPIEPNNLNARIGYSFNAYLDLGLEYNFTLVVDKLGSVDRELSTRFLFLKANLPIGDRARVYVMAGPASVRLTSSTELESTVQNDTDAGFGVGYQYRTESDVVINIDYLRYYDDNQYDGLKFNRGVTVDSLNIGLVQHF